MVSRTVIRGHEVSRSAFAAFVSFFSFSFPPNTFLGRDGTAFRVIVSNAAFSARQVRLQLTSGSYSSSLDREKEREREREREREGENVT